MSFPAEFYGLTTLYGRRLINNTGFQTGSVEKDNGGIFTFSELRYFILDTTTGHPGGTSSKHQHSHATALPCSSRHVRGALGPPRCCDPVGGTVDTAQLGTAIGHQHHGSKTAGNATLEPQSRSQILTDAQKL